ncbi:MAG: penicillin-binding transpeptidase domain-containing protein [Clostridium sp.]
MKRRKIMKNESENQKGKANKNILRLTYLFSALFICMAGYFAWFIQFESENVIGNSYNARLDRFSDRIIRGNVLSDDGTVLAETKVAEDGTESRYYPYDYLFAHSVGYSTNNGKTGLESIANFYLLSSHVNLVEKAVNELQGQKNIGDNVVTTLDLSLQQAASDALGKNRGAVVVMEPDTGKVLAMVSQPNFNANSVDEKWEELVSPDNTKAQLINRATQGLYPPGSTFKILTILEYMKENPGTYENFQFNCTGLYETGDYKIKCYHSEAHGEQNLTQAFANSCNGAFAYMGEQIDPAKFHALANQFLFNSTLPLALPYNKSIFNMDAGADTWERLQTSIGQGTTQITPMHNLLITAAIANGGTLMKPYFIDHVENVGGQTVKKFQPSAYGSLMSAEDAGTLSALMKSVVDEGTASALRTEQYTAAGKTGSAEFETGKETHSWFVGYAPAENPRIAISVIVEEGGSGGKVAAPIARTVFDTYFAEGN